MPSYSSPQAHPRQGAHVSYETDVYPQPVMHPESYGRYADSGDNAPEIWSSQTGLRYRVDGLQDPETEAAVRDVLGQPDPADIHFSQCRLHERVYAFEVKETVTRTVRIGPPGSRYYRPRCEACAGASAGGRRGADTSVCRHVVWVLDHLAHQGLGGGAAHPDATLTMGPDGHAVEMGSPYELCRAMPLDQLASRLHCRVAPPAGQDADEAVDMGRVAEVRRMLAAVSESGNFDHYDERVLMGAGALNGDNPVRRGDLDGTLFRMLYANPSFFAYFRSQLNDECGSNRDMGHREYRRGDGEYRQRHREQSSREHRQHSSREHHEYDGREHRDYSRHARHSSRPHRRSTHAPRVQYDYEMHID